MLQLVPKQTSSSSVSTSESKSKRKRIEDSLTHKRGDGDKYRPWIDVYKPVTSKELALHYSKVNGIRDWIRRAVAHHATQHMKPDYHPMVLVLCGKSGCGKSTAVELLCQEDGIQLEVLVGDLSAELSTSSYYSTSDSNRTQQFDQSSLAGALVLSRRQSQEEDNADYILRCKYSKLSLSVPSKPNSRDTLQVQAQRNVRGRFAKTIAAAAPVLEINPPASVVSIVHDPILDPTSMYALGNTNGSAARTSTAEVVRSARGPVVVILSDVQGNDGLQHDVDACLPPQLRTGIILETLHCTPITTKKTVSVLLKILGKAMLPSAPSATALESIATASIGDLRQAINQLQFLCTRKMKISLPRPETSLGSISLPLDADNGVEELSDSDFDCFPKRQTSSLKSDGRLVRSSSHTSTVSYTSTTSMNSLTSSSSRKRPFVIDDSDDEIDVGDYSPRAINGDRLVIGDQVKENVDNDCTRTVDKSYSSLQSVAKLANATLNEYGKLDFDPDEVFTRSDLLSELLFSFMQSNSVGSIENSSRIANFASVESIAGNSTSTFEDAYFVECVNDHSQNVCPMQQISDALSSFSDVDLFASRRFSTSFQLDRSDSAFPDEYVCSISSRSCAVARNAGARELVAAGKARGAPHSFFGIRRPAIFNLRQRASATRQRVQSLRHLLSRQTPTPTSSSTQILDSALGGGNTEGGSIDGTNREVVLTLIPSLRALHHACTEHQSSQIQHHIANHRRELSDLIHQVSSFLYANSSTSSIDPLSIVGSGNHTPGDSSSIVAGDDIED